MSLQNYALLFPGKGIALDSFEAMKVLASNGFELISDSYFVPRTLDDGSWLYGDQVKFKENSMEDLITLLKDNIQLSVTVSNEELTFTCVSQSRYHNPFLLLGWSKKIFDRLSLPRQHHYKKMIREYSKKAKAAYVFITGDGIDELEDKFLEIDGQRILENKNSNGNHFPIRSLWIDIDITSTIPLGAKFVNRGYLDHNFKEYAIIV